MDSMIITIHQPEYLPWMGFFDRIDQSDVFVVLDTVLFQKKGFLGRNKIKTAQGTQWINVPVNGEDKSKNIYQVRIGDIGGWQKKHWNAIHCNYANAPFFGEYSEIFREAIVSKKWDFLADLDFYLTEKTMALLGITAKLVKSSSLGINSKGTGLNIDICKQLGADVFLLGPGFTEQGKQHHLDIKKIEEAGIKVAYQKFTHPEYSQKFESLGFIPYLSIIDLLFNCGPKSLDIIRSGRNAALSGKRSI